MSKKVFYIQENGDKVYTLNGKYHRDDGPALEYSNGTQTWWQYGMLHREDGPALITYDGQKKWYLYDKLHRTDGPAIEFSNGHKEWWLFGSRHRENGPAVIRITNEQQWFLNGIEYSKEEYHQVLNRTKLLIIAIGRDINNEQFYHSYRVSRSDIDYNDATNVAAHVLTSCQLENLSNIDFISISRHDEVLAQYFRTYSHEQDKLVDKLIKLNSLAENRYNSSGHLL